MEPFLKSVATHIYQTHSDHFENLSIVFPNRRSGVFFLEHFKQLNNKAIWLPQIITINEFISKLTPIQHTDPINLLATLYNIYKQVSNSKEPFDEFYIWGQLMLNDFDDVDKYLVDPHAIFTNVKEFKVFDQKIDYLTEEQIGVLKQFFSQFDPEKKTKLKENFLEIWQIMLPIYNQFSAYCLQHNLAYEGFIYKQASQNIKKSDCKNLPKHIAFVGFNAINKCEEVIFEQLKRTKQASFYWDYDSYFVENKEQEAGTFIRKFISTFPNPEGFLPQSELLSTNKHFELISSPTVSGQLGIASTILANCDSKDFSNTALILADESLLQPSLFHIPSAISDVNITMGYPVQNSLASTFIELVCDLQLTRRESKGITSFYHKKAIPILRHPYIATLSRNENFSLVDKLTGQNRFYIDAEELRDIPILDQIFVPVNTADQFAEYLQKLIDTLVTQLIQHETQTNLFAIDTEFLYHIGLKNNQLTTQLKQNNIAVTLPTYFKLLKKAFSALSVPFEGEPIKGLQIMGFLETRNLDFETVIIASFNEGQLPFSQSGASFIPYSLRRGFGLPTREMQDAMYAYYFFRLLQRAKNVHLVYCNNADGTFTGEPSRFAYQLQYSNDFKLEIKHTAQAIQVMVSNAIVISKTGTVLDALERFLLPENPATLSPSAITTYVTCPLKFYFHTILKLYEADSIEDQVDARLFGNIFHFAVQHLYQPYADKKELISADSLNHLSKQNEHLEHIIQMAFNKTFHKSNPDKHFQIEGKNSLVAEAIKKYILAMLIIDANATPFSILALEEKFNRAVSLTQSGFGAVKVLIEGHIDRVDRTDKGIRVIDYKTGKDELKFSSIDDLFNPQSIGKNKAVIQTFIYSWICESKFPSEKIINPTVYKVKQLFDQELNFEIKSNDKTDYDGNFKSVSQPFESQLVHVLNEIFDKNKPFYQTTEAKHCVYCPYNGICNR